MNRLSQLYASISGVASLNGPTKVYPDSVNIYIISDYDSFANYRVTTSVGSLERNGNQITLTVPEDAPIGYLQLTLTKNDTSAKYTVVLGDHYVVRPKITYPAAGEIDVLEYITLTTDPYACKPAGEYEHVATTWELSTNPQFTNVIWSSVADAVNLVAVDVPIPLDELTNYFVRVKHIGAEVGESNWSEVTAFTTKISFVDTPVLSGATAATELNDVVLTIDNYDANATYTFNPSHGTVVQSGATVTWSLPEVHADTQATLNVQARLGTNDSLVATHTVDITNIVISKPSVLAPTGADVLEYPTFECTPFNLVAGDETHAYTRWTLATTPTFETGSVVWTTDTSDTSVVCGIPLNEMTTYYVKVQHFGQLQASPVSDTVQFTTKISFVDTPVLSGANTWDELGPATIAITNYDAAATYTLTPSIGTASHAGGTITWDLPEIAEDITATLEVMATIGTNDSLVATHEITVTNIIIEAPSITAPSGTDVLEYPTLECSAFTVLAGTDTYDSTDWEVATDVSFTDIVWSTNGAGTSVQVEVPLNELTTYYVRARHQGALQPSAWGVATQFTTKISFVDTPSLTGPAVWDELKTADVTITNFDNEATYTITPSVGTVILEGATISWSLPEVNEDTPATVEVQARVGTNDSLVATFGLNIQNIVIANPSVTAPTGTNVVEYPTLVATDFNVTTGADTYTSTDWQISTNSSFTNIIWSNNSTGTSTTVGVPLNELTTYYVRARHNGALQSSSWGTYTQFTTKVSFVDTPVLSGATAANELTDVVVSVTNYDPLAVYTIDTAFGSYTWNAGTITWSLPTVEADTAATLQVYATVGSNNSLTASKNLTILNVATVTPVMTGPTGTEVLEFPTLTASAYTSDPEGEDTHASSDWQVSTNSGFTNVIWQSLNDSSNLESAVVGSPLSEQTTYYARVRYHGERGTSDWSAPISFTTRISFVDTPLLGGPSTGNELTNISVPISNYDAVVTYHISVTHGSTSRSSGTITWTLPSVSADTQATMSVYAVKDGKTSLTATKTITIYLVLVEDTAIQVTDYSSVEDSSTGFEHV